jgi:MoaA/NifB/PqqE/SkfB family radical SAM enzyme
MRACGNHMLSNHRVLCQRGVIWLGQTCNLRCHFCYFADRIKSAAHPEHAFMSIAKAKEICRVLVDVYHNNSVDIQGGEPTIYPQIEDLVKYSHDIGLKPTLITNAIALSDRARCLRLKNAGLFDLLISVHALGDVYDRIVRTEGASKKQQKALKNLREAGVPYRFNTVLSMDVLDQLKDIAQFAIDQGSRAVNFIAFNPFVDQSIDHRRSKEIIPQYSRLADKLLPCIDLLDKFGVETNVRYLPFCVFPPAYRKFVQNFQQIVYDLHEWESAGEVWSGASAQRCSLEQLAAPTDFHSHIKALRINYFLTYGDQNESSRTAGSSIFSGAIEKIHGLATRCDPKSIRICVYGNHRLGVALVVQFLKRYPELKDRCCLAAMISSKGFVTADQLLGCPWKDEEWLGENKPEIIINPSMQSRVQIQQVLLRLGLASRTVTVFEDDAAGFVPQFNMREMGEVEGFSDTEYAYKEFRILMTKLMHPYMKGGECQRCSLVGICDGFHKDYANLFGFEEAHPEDLGCTIYDPRHYMAEQMKVVEPEEYSWALPEPTVAIRASNQ